MTTEKNAPLPREGLAGVLDRLAGPGATQAELALQFLLPLVAAVTAVFYVALSEVAHWSTLQYLVCALLAFDLVGGIVTNASSSGKRWYHRASQGPLQHTGFIALHVVHLALVSWLFLGLDVAWLTTAAAYLLIAGTAIICTPAYLQRPVALIMYTGSLLMALYVLKAPVGLEWFLPLFYLKLLVAHLPKEATETP
ncbi:hypothetical protein CAI21_09465 [Alkalilimnicola ehrlichii]|uniref:Uncharacterized protein n=1 Tax=Alkalilimnicola ehrlichii TaxID=351052 RepID=A0A3E0WXC2_9GAMM|nr:hypothetical protein [Alkalilimnicola ehrlichii]RFA29298.1 hypothetical protein CAI21_09465 [Alkalilimnicola ehrlichii]RFA36811.1 hypothetical protein CAL65_09800 [Alkalilimnicola ehrlichii]